MRRFGLIGYPLGHSFSKKYFTEKFEKEKIEDCEYDLYPLEDIEELPDLIKSEKE
ncbi:MAG: shikimate dehydrogenase, partial [Cytophagia bacterium]|nr:shikimate dehydrogenase [Cytophagia bacterium]